MQRKFQSRVLSYLTLFPSPDSSKFSAGKENYRLSWENFAESSSICDSNEILVENFDLIEVDKKDLICSA